MDTDDGVHHEVAGIGRCRAGLEDLDNYHGAEVANAAMIIDLFPKLIYHQGMETSPPPHPADDPFPFLYHQLIYTLVGLLPPPLNGSPEALRARDHAAIAKAAALLPVGANEIDLAAHCIAARAQAEDMLRLVREHEGDVGLVIRLNAQYGSMVRTSLAVHGRLMRVQAIRQKRETSEAAAKADSWTQFLNERLMLAVADARVKPVEAAPDGAAEIEDDVSEDETNSQDVAFETQMRDYVRNAGAGGSGATGPSGDMAGLFLARALMAGRASAAEGRESGARAG